MSVYPALKQDLSCDVVVLGAGITGAFIAQCLAEEGFDTVVLDKRDVCAGSTSANTALLQYELDISLVDLTKRMGRSGAEQVYRVCHDSITAIEHLVTRHNLGCVYQRRKSVYLASHRSEGPLLREECSARRAVGIEVECWDDTEVRSQFSFSRPAALVSQQAGELDSHRLAHALLALAARRGTRIFDRTHVEKYHTDSTGVRLQTDRGCKVVASHAIFATGYESQEFLPRHIVKLKSTYALASEPLEEFPGWWERCLIWETLRPYLYLRTTHDNRALVGGEDDDFHSPTRRDRRVDAKTDRLASRFTEMFPAIELEVAFRWAGTFGETKDGLPYIGQVRQMPHCHFALGFGGNGITYSFIAAEIIRDTLLQRPNRNARLFGFDR